VRPGDAALAEELRKRLLAFEAAVGELPGISTEARRITLVEQLVESDRRKRYRTALRGMNISEVRADPSSPLFDPVKAAVLADQRAHREEAFWLTFLSVHFGRNPRGGWRYAAGVYGGLGSDPWTWEHVAQDAAAFRAWIDANYAALYAGGLGGFGNHRKYERLADTGRVVQTYVEWVGPARSHVERFDQLIGGGSARDGFHAAFLSMSMIFRFGRLARFDYLSTVAHLGLAAIEPDGAYVESATGPLAGARLLFDRGSRRATPSDMEARVRRLDDYLRIGLDTLEDALCNWQKSPHAFMPFRG
jgi:hypothetical protein